MGSWFVKPETERVSLPDGQWLDLKKRLNAGDDRRRMTMVIKEFRQDGRYTPDPEMVGKADVLIYLVDWSLRDDAGSKVKIDTEGAKASAIDSLDPDKFKVIADAVEAHAKAMEAERDASKKSTDGESASSATSPSAA
jgi:hypothetical protein